MAHVTDSRINQYLYLLDRRWNSLEFEVQCHVRQGMRQGILQNVDGVIRLTESAVAARPNRDSL